MSRIGKKPIQIPEKVKVSISGSEVTATGALGTLKFAMADGIKAEMKDNVLIVSLPEGKEKLMNAVYGTTRARINNLVLGVSQGFNKILDMQGLGYKAAVAGNKLTMELGFSHPVVFPIPQGITIEVDPKQLALIIKGTDKVLVGDVAARIRRISPPEPYKGSGIRYRNEHIVRKAGKTAAAKK